MNHTIFEDLLMKLEKRQYAAIKREDYHKLICELLNIYNSKSLNGDPVPQDCLALQDWVSNRVAIDYKYSVIGPANEHFCIGVIFGIYAMFYGIIGE